MTKNPIQQARGSKNLSRGDLAVLAGCSVALVNLNENGLVPNPSPKILGALRQVGFDTDAISRDYAAWREEKAAALLASTVG